VAAARWERGWDRRATRAFWIWAENQRNNGRPGGPALPGRDDAAQEKGEERMTLRALQVAVGERLRMVAPLGGVPVYLEVGGRVAGLERLALRAGQGAVVVHEVAFVLNTAQGAEPPALGQVLEGKALVTVSCWWHAAGRRCFEGKEWREGQGEGGALALAEAVLLGLHRWSDESRGVGRMLAERQALMPAPGSEQLIHYVPRNAKGGEERFRPMPQVMKAPDWSGGCYVVDFEVAVKLGEVEMQSE
jgi:hypothetical protein